LVDIVKKFLKNEEGQVVVEWLLLMAMAFITAYVLINGDTLQGFTGRMLGDIQSRLGNVVRNGEMEPGGAQQGSSGHPSDARRLKALHL
jgi:Flp pilus assembly pilin Flp